MTRLGLGSYACAWAIGVPGFETPRAPMTALDLLRFTNELGLRVLQIADNLPLHKLEAVERKALYDEAQKLGIQIEVGTCGISTEHLRKYIEIAAQFDSPILRVVVDTAAHHPSPEEVIAQIRLVLPELAQAGVILAIENHDRLKTTTLVSILQQIDHPTVRICLDTVNSFGALEGPELVVSALGPYVVSLHLKEFVVQRLRHNMGFEVIGKPAGQGMLDTPWLLNTLHNFGREFNATIELWLQPEASMSATIAKEREWVHQSVAYLRTLIKD